MWAIWRCGQTEDTSRVRDLSVGGLFIETRKVCPIGATVELHFLVQDGEIRANATVRYVKVVEVGLVYNSRLFVARTGRDLQRWLKG